MQCAYLRQYQAGNTSSRKITKVQQLGPCRNGALHKKNLRLKKNVHCTLYSVHSTHILYSVHYLAHKQEIYVYFYIYVYIHIYVIYVYVYADAFASTVTGSVLCGNSHDFWDNVVKIFFQMNMHIKTGFYFHTCFRDPLNYNCFLINFFIIIVQYVAVCTLAYPR